MLPSRKGLPVTPLYVRTLWTRAVVLYRSSLALSLTAHSVCSFETLLTFCYISPQLECKLCEPRSCLSCSLLHPQHPEKFLAHVVIVNISHIKKIRLQSQPLGSVFMTPKLVLFLLHSAPRAESGIRGKGTGWGSDLASAATLVVPSDKSFPPRWPPFIHRC